MDPATLPLREIHLPASPGWWPPAPGWWLLPGMVLLIAAVTWYFYRWRKRRKYSAINLARQELVGIKTRYAVDRDVRFCVRAVSALLRRLCISVFPRAETAGLTGADWLAFLRTEGRGQKTEDRKRRTMVLPIPWRGRARVRGKTNGNEGKGLKTGERGQGVEGVIPENTGKLLLEAPYRKHVAEEEVELLIAFCSDWIETLAETTT